MPEPMRCTRCGSDEMIPRCRVVDRGDDNSRFDLQVEVQRRPNAVLFKRPERSNVSAQVCGACGHAEFYADAPRALFAAYMQADASPAVSAREELERTREALADSQVRLQELEEKLSFMEQLLENDHPPAAVPTANFTDRTQTVLDIAYNLAVSLRHEAVLPEHLALALLREAEGVAVATLFNLSVSLEALQREFGARLPPRSAARPGVNKPTWSLDAVRVLEQAIRDSRELGHPYVGTEHVLLALVRDSTGMSAQVLARHGVGSEQVQKEVRRLLAGTSG